MQSLKENSIGSPIKSQIFLPISLAVSLMMLKVVTKSSSTASWCVSESLSKISPGSTSAGWNKEKYQDYNNQRHYFIITGYNQQNVGKGGKDLTIK